jgi:hypothetical protein
MDICRQVKPVPVTVEPGHTVSCHLYLADPGKP